MPKSHEMEELSSPKSLRLGQELFEDGERSPSYDSDSPSDTLSVNGGASASTSARSSRLSSLGSGFSTRSATSSESDSETGALDNVRVVARVRPLNLSEKERGDKNIIKLPANSNGAVWIDNSFGQIKPFTFNAAFGEETSQQEMFEQCGIKHLVEMAVEGYSCTAFAYGQTGSGKTYTITGPLENSAHKETFIPDQEMQGLIERCFHYLFELKENHSDVEFTLKASYLEVYNEKVQDLLNPSSARDSLPVRWARDRGFYVENLFFVECDTVDDLSAVLEEGLGNRQVGSHLMNDHSSRSHSMLTVYIDIESSDPIDSSGYPVVKHGKLSLVDLAGSERVKETRSIGGSFTESQNINKSLLTLGNCISALSDPRKKGGHIPYRDSKLTKLLADSLGGDGITLMIACISPSSDVVQDTLNTLRYAHRAKRIKNKPVVHMDPKEKLILSLKREIKLLRTENAYFRQQLGISSSESQTSLFSNDSKATTTTSTENESTPKLNPPSLHPGNQLQAPEDSQRLTTASMALGANSGLYDMLQEYMVENEHLRSANVELVHSREEVTRQQMVLSRENDRLSKKVEELERVIVSSPMSLRTLSGVESLRGIERTSSLPEEQFMGSIPGHNGGARPSQFAAERTRLERRNSLPMQSKERRRSISDPSEPPRVVTKFPPIQNGPYPNYVGQGGWSQIPEAHTPPQEVVPEPNNNIASRVPPPNSVPGPSHKPKPTVSTKKRSQPALINERHKPVNSYARMFAAQKQKKAKENEGKIVENVEPNQDVGATDRLNSQVHHQVHMDASGYSGHPSVGWPVDNGIHPSYDPALAGNLQLAERTRQELRELDSQIEYHKFMAHNRYSNHPPR